MWDIYRFCVGQFYYNLDMHNHKRSESTEQQEAKHFVPYLTYHILCPNLVHMNGMDTNEFQAHYTVCWFCKMILSLGIGAHASVIRRGLSEPCAANRQEIAIPKGGGSSQIQDFKGVQTPPTPADAYPWVETTRNSKGSKNGPSFDFG